MALKSEFARARVKFVEAFEPTPNPSREGNRGKRNRKQINL
jgi:hypothetical protein